MALAIIFKIYKAVLLNEKKTLKDPRCFKDFPQQYLDKAHVTPFSCAHFFGLNWSLWFPPSASKTLSRCLSISFLGTITTSFLVFVAAATWKHSCFPISGMTFSPLLSEQHSHSSHLVLYLSKSCLFNTTLLRFLSSSASQMSVFASKFALTCVLSLEYL